MHNYKAIKLSTSLSKESAIDFVAWLKRLNKKKAILLFDAVYSKKASSKAELFKIVFNKNYSKEVDFLLRNEMRLLIPLIQQFIIEHTESEDLPKEMAFLNFLLENSLHDIFKSDIDKFIKHYSKTNETEQVLRLEDKKIAFQLRFLPRNSKALLKLRDYIFQTIQATSNEYLVPKCKLILHLAICERIAWQYNSDIAITDLQSFNLPKSYSANKTALFYFTKAQSFASHGQDKIDLLNECKAIIPKSSKLENFNGEEAYIDSMIGLEYYLLADLENAFKYYKAAMPKVDKLNAIQRMQLIFNYVSLLCRLEQFQLAEKIISKNYGLFENTVYEEKLKIFQFFCAARGNKKNTLRKFLPYSVEGDSKDTKLYIRILECMVLYQEQETDLLLTYLQNIYNTVRYNKKLDKAFIGVVRIFKHFVQALEQSSTAKKTEKLQKIFEESEAFIESYRLGFGSNMLCSQWLNAEIKMEIERLN